MERALVIGAGGGIGAAVQAALSVRLGAGAVVGMSRSADGLDVTDEAGLARRLGALEGPFDLVLVATGALRGAGRPPEKALKELSPAAFADQFAVNAAGPMLVLKHALRLLPRDRRVVFAALSARVGSIGDNRLGGWYSYRMAKAALNQGVHCAAIELARSHRQAICVALHPGTVATPFTSDYAGRHPAVPPAEAAGNLLRVIDGLTPADSGGFFDWAGDRVPW
ncbi:NAD(P)-dependent dehydrogenase (short-subunit alcohol dehydrogenase family) [Rhodovulum bhavnagarense]|uniref:NAD(P)-dependent dehydrogenase (Short-subunit alcohol dehydrogenase family) n=1 Tax=Rhodovulum bhavnagarense TaxID=992286 RepID=A0A4V2SW22_9RHOB|nr:SDR family oxidoreductase [Rhodovulum bhavnagarense]TCP60686.1 NAD(P)-dependent dehydrogenase (short-subunit alcohol dehydrogenase family) [Rhodovulum bhavnagarense]